MKIFDFFKRKKIDPDIKQVRKRSTVEQELLDRCQNGHRINPTNDYSHVIGKETIVTGYTNRAMEHNTTALGNYSHTVGADNGLSHTSFIDRFEVGIIGTDNE